MGGLRKQIPVTYWTMMIATFAIAGVPGFSGFFSKDAILSATFLSPYGGPILWGIGALTVLLTAFYMFRLIFLTFFGKPEYDEHRVHVHESPKIMLVPLIILAIFSVIGGWQAAPALWGGEDHFESFLKPVFEAQNAPVQAYSAAMNARTIEQQLTLVAFLLAAIGFLIAWWLCIKSPDARRKLAETFSAPYKLLLNKYYVDEIYDGAIVKPLVWGSTNILWHAIDEGAIDGTVNGIARITNETGDATRHMESGNTRSYATWIVIGAVAFTSLLLWLAVR